MRDAINQYCARIGVDPLLVQGAGGNVSWKDGSTLWVKASGTWLADALKRDIFVPVALDGLTQSLAAGDFSVQPQALEGSTLKPSIETLLHALMPHRVVVHVHAVDVLAHLVRQDWLSSVAERAGDASTWASVGYFKPGAALAHAVWQALSSKPAARVVFLQSHGLVVGGATIGEVDQTLRDVVAGFRGQPGPASEGRSFDETSSAPAGWSAIPDASVQALALDERMSAYLQPAWALYPDHVVFLGARARFVQSTDELTRLAPDVSVAFVLGAGAFAYGELTAARLAQLRCYVDVISRQSAPDQLRTLSDDQIAELLNWDAERYRQSLSA